MLLGHELTHVVQQRVGVVSVPRDKDGGGPAINADPARGRSHGTGQREGNGFLQDTLADRIDGLDFRQARRSAGSTG